MRTITSALSAPVLALVVAALAIVSPDAGAQLAPTFFQIYNGRIQATSQGSPQDGDTIVAIFEGGTASTSIDSSGAFQGLTLTRSQNNEVPVRFEVRRGGTRFTVVSSDGATTPLTTTFIGSSNPLSAAFGAQTINGFMGPSSGGGGGGDGDGAGSGGGSPDVNGDGIVDMEDSRAVLRYIIGFQRDTVDDPSSLDVNADDRITTDDVIEIMRRMGETIEAPAEGGDDDADA